CRNCRDEQVDLRAHLLLLLPDGSLGCSDELEPELLGVEVVDVSAICLQAEEGVTQPGGQHVVPVVWILLQVLDGEPVLTRGTSRWRPSQGVGRALQMQEPPPLTGCEPATKRGRQVVALEHPIDRLRGVGEYDGDGERSECRYP